MSWGLKAICILSLLTSSSWTHARSVRPNNLRGEGLPQSSYRDEEADVNGDEAGDRARVDGDVTIAEPRVVNSG